MNNEELIKALRCLKVETGSLACLGCGHENSCSVYGCAIIRQAVDVLEAKAAEIEQLTKELEMARAERDAKTKAQIQMAKIEEERGTLRNELCLKCGKYQYSHEGACNGCRWKKEE